MHVALVMNSAYGMKILRSDLIRFLQSVGHQVTAICPSDHPAWIDLQRLDLQLEDWPVTRDGMNLLREALSIIRLRRILIRTRPNVTLCFTPKAVLLGSLAARTIRQSNVYSVITGLGFLFGRPQHQVTTRERIFHIMFRHALTQNRVVFFQNPDDLELFVSHNIVPRDRTCRIFGSGVDTRHFAPLPPSHTTNDTVFLMIARLIGPKGVLEYIEAARILIQEGASASFRLLGSFDDHPTAINPQTINAATHAGVIDYCGTTDDVRPYIRDADVFVLPSYYREGTPRATLEAMAMGKPIITTDSPGCRETVVHNRNGYLVPPRDSLALAHAMRQLIGNLRRNQRMGLESRQLAQRLYDVDKVHAHMLDRISQTLRPRNDESEKATNR